MAEHHRGYSLKAPSPADSDSARGLPGRSWPAVDDHIVQPEISRDEIIGGRKVVVMPAERPHATQQVRLDYVIGANVAAGYEAASDLLTRHDVDSDFASDTCVYKAVDDPQTGGRQLEELAFEIVAGQNERDVTEKAQRMAARGVRRILAIFVKKGRVAEWSGEAWRTLSPDAEIVDRCLIRPVAVAALLEAAAADNAVVEALAAKGNPVLRRREAAAKAEGRAAGKAEAVLAVLAARGIAVSAAERQAILGCRDLERLESWLTRAAVEASTAAVLLGPP